MLHPEVETLLELIRQRGSAPTHSLAVHEARTLYRERGRLTQPAPPPMRSVEALSAQGAQGAIPCRLYRPLNAAASPLPVLMFFHGGGWVIGDLDTHDVLCRQLAAQSGCAVVAVDYRLAPEHPFPAAVLDCIAATTWVHAHAHELALNAERIAVGGDSAGGNLAAVVALDARDRQHLPIAFQLLIYPATDMRAENPFADDPRLLLTRETMRYFHDHYITQPADDLDWRASPLLNADLSGLPHALVLTAAYDPLHGEGAAYAARLSAAGSPCTLVCFERQIHGFILMSQVLTEARTAVTLCAAALHEALCPDPS